MPTNGANPQPGLIQHRLAIPRQPVPKRLPNERVQNFEETYLPLNFDTAIIEAVR
jgi:hypothetical protein